MQPAPPTRGARVLHALETLGLRALVARGFRRRFAQTATGRIHVIEAHGTGLAPPLFVVHGLGSSASDLGPLLIRLRRHTERVVAVDLPGHGWSDAIPKGVPLQDALLEALDSVYDGSAVGVGNSLGGLVMTRWALACPGRVKGLVLMSPGGAPTGQLEDLLGTFDLSQQSEGVRFIDRVMARPSPYWVRQIQGWGVRHRMSRPGTRAVLEEASDAHMLTAEDVAALPDDTLVIWGKGDRVLPQEHLAFWKANLPKGAVVEEPEGMGHSPYLDNPTAVANRIALYLKDVVG